jgi:hypothetical protein
MNPNRRRHDNVIHLAPIATWVLLAVSACGAGLVFVDFKNQAHRRAEKISELQRSLAELRLTNEAIRVQNLNAASPNGLRKQRQDKTFMSEYLAITPDRLVVVTDSPRDESQIRPVTNTHRE